MIRSLLHDPRRLVLGAALLCLVPLAQGAAPAARPDPLDATAPVPAFQHVPSFGGYRPYAEQPVGVWREANERVRQAGGWRAYAREVGSARPEAVAPIRPEAATPMQPAPATPMQPAPATPARPAAAPPAHRH